MSGTKEDAAIAKVTSKARAAIFLKAAFDALHDAGGSLPLKEIKHEIVKRVELTEKDRGVYEKTGYVRWESILHFYSIDCAKAGFIRKGAACGTSRRMGTLPASVPQPSCSTKPCRAIASGRPVQS